MEKLERARKQRTAWQRAGAILRERHRTEFDRIYRAEYRRAVGEAEPAKPRGYVWDVLDEGRAYG